VEADVTNKMAKGLRALLETLLIKEGYSRKQRLEILATNNYPDIRNHVFHLIRTIMRKARLEGKPYADNLLIEMSIAIENVGATSSVESDTDSSSLSYLTVSEELPSDVRDDPEDEEDSGELTDQQEEGCKALSPSCPQSSNKTGPLRGTSTSLERNTRDTFILFSRSPSIESENEFGNSNMSNGSARLETVVKKLTKRKRVLCKNSQSQSQTQKRVTRSQTRLLTSIGDPCSSTSEAPRATGRGRKALPRENEPVPSTSSCFKDHTPRKKSRKGTAPSKRMRKI
jgi:hypothetical protein